MIETTDPTNGGDNEALPRSRPLDASAAGHKLTLLQYYQEGDIDRLREHIKQSIDNSSFNTQELIELAKGSKESASLVKELVSLHKIDETELADRIAKEILRDIEAYTDLHLEKYDNKFTLNAPQLSSQVDGSKAKFFNLISLLKDVSILGRKLLETSTRFDSSKPTTVSQATAAPPVSSPSLQVRAFQSDRGDGGPQHHLHHARDTKSQMSEGDATSDDLLAALIESSSTDDFLVLSSSLDSISLRDMMIAALVIVTSHECFTLSHDIQGVVMVLRRAKFLIKNILAPKNQMELVTRLLTAIGRYNEMKYVFDLFRDRNQFEILLSKGVEKTPGLRIALYNYVKKHPEFYALVTLNFSMFREIADSLQASSHKRLEKLIQYGQIKKAKARKKFSLIPPGQVGEAPDQSHQQLHQLRLEASTREQAPLAPASPMRKSSSIATSLSGLAGCKFDLVGGDVNAQGAETGVLAGDPAAASNNNKPLYSRDSLNLCLVELVDAADCFARAGCYKRSNDCENKAKLVALQLALLPCNINVLGLKQAELADIIVSLECFADAHILAQAYDYHLTWQQALFRNVVLRGQAHYLDEFCSACDLSEALVLELAVLYRQYLANNQLSHEQLASLGNSMKSILGRLRRVALKCQLYTEFNFNDAKEELLRNPSVRAYLKDLKLA